MQEDEKIYEEINLKLVFILEELKAFRSDLKALSRRIELLEIILLTPEEVDEEDSDEDLEYEGDKLLAWAKLKDGLGL